MKCIDLKGKTAVVTGARQGIGRAVAVELARAGADIFAVDLAIDERDEVCAELAGLGVRCYPAACNVADEEAVRALFARVREACGAADILANNAGITKDAMTKNMTAERFRQVLDVNLVGSFLCAKEAMLLLKAAGRGGAIVNFSSIAGFLGNPGQTNYSASKAGVVGLTRTMALEYARYGIRVNAVVPGFINTPMTTAIPEDLKKAGIAKIPLGRAGEPEDVANAVAFLASDLAAFITGHCVHVNGGRYM